MAITKKQEIKTPSTALSTALKEDNKELAIREVSRLTVTRIMEARDHRVDLEFSLASLRNSYNFYKNNDVKDRIKHMSRIKVEASYVKKRLAEIPAYPYLIELRNKNEDELLRTLALMIVNVVDYFKTADKMHPEEIQEAALRISYQFAGITLEDVALCFHKAQSGQFGKNYNRLDCAVLMDWLNEYEKIVQSVGMERNHRMHNNEKSGVNKNGHEYRIIQPTRLKELM